MRSGAMSLRSSARSASALRSSRIARRYPARMDDPRVARWAASGAMALTGLPDEPLGPPEALVEGIDRLARPFPGPGRAGTARRARRAHGVVAPRHHELRRQLSAASPCETGSWPCRCRGREDMETVPAWLELDEAPRSAPATWSAVEASLTARRPRTTWRSGPRCWVCPSARVGEAARRPDVAAEHARRARRRRAAAAAWSSSTCPRCGRARSAATSWPRAGATVVKVESRSRPDGARRGPPAFFDLLNGRKRSVALDCQHPEGRRTAPRAGAAGRHRDRGEPAAGARSARASARADLVERGGPQVWVSITGYGRSR